MEEYLTRKVASRLIFCSYSPRLKRSIVLVYTHSVISTIDNLDIFKRKPIKDNFIDVSVHAWKTFKWYRPCAKRVLAAERSNMADLVNCTQNPHHNQTKWSFYISQRRNLKQKSVCRTFPLFKKRFWGSFKMKIEREGDKESMWKLYRVSQDCRKKWTFSCKETFMDRETYFT